MAESLCRIDDLTGKSALLTPGDRIVLGRMGSFPLGEDDAYMHREFLEISYTGGGWLLRNIGSRLAATIESRGDGPMHSTKLGSGSAMTLLPGPVALVFSTGERTYEVHVDVRGKQLTRPVVRHDASEDATAGAIILNHEQKELIKALVAPLVAYPGATDDLIPSVSKLSKQLHWTEKKTNSKIETICRIIERQAGITLPKNYRVNLAHYAYETGLG